MNRMGLGHIAQRGVIAALLWVPYCVPTAAACPFEIIKTCRCPSLCNSDTCEKTCVIGGNLPSGACYYQCPIDCPCGGIACRPTPRWVTFLDRWVDEAHADELDSHPEGTHGGIEVHNADGEFVILSKEESERADEESAGIGIRVVRGSSGTIIVGDVVTGGPAEKAGLHPGDEIVSVDGRNSKGSPVATVSRWLRGRPGTLVVLRVRGKGGKVLKVPLNRASFGGFGPEKKATVSLKQVPAANFGPQGCPSESDGCHFLTKDGGACVFTCGTPK